MFRITQKETKQGLELMAILGQALKGDKQAERF